jgi:hypothetical protein
MRLFSPKVLPRLSELSESSDRQQQAFEKLREKAMS